MSRPKDKEFVILDSAAVCFLDKGFSNTTIQEIADKAEISKGSVYTYFNDKEELFIKSVEYIHKEIVRKIKSRDSKKIEFQKRFAAFLKFILIDFEDDFKKIRSLIFGNISNLKSETLDNFHISVKKTNVEFENIVSDIIRQGYDEGKLREIDREFDTSLILGLIFYRNAPSGFEKSKRGKKEEIDKLIDFVINGMGRK